MALFVLEDIFTTFPGFCPEDTSTFLVCLFVVFRKAVGLRGDSLI